MRKLSEQQLADLIRLAKERSETQVQSVTQLIDDDRQVYALSISLAIGMLRGAAEVMRDGMQQQNGRRPSEEEALGYVLCDVLEKLGIRYERRAAP